MKNSMILVLSLLAYSTTAKAAPNPWPFDFDPLIAENPQGISDGLAELGADLPGLPDDEMVEVTLGEVTLYLFADVAEALIRARESGPQIAPATARTPVMCQLHAAFTIPALAIEPASATCEQAEHNIAAAFDATTCLEVEFPETYVFSHPPGQVESDTVQTFEGLIALAGEALRHLDYPTALLPDDFMEVARSVVAKLRYDVLSSQIDARLNAYDNALAELQAATDCFAPSTSSAFAASVADLITELGAARQHLDELYAAGLAQASVDQEEVVQMCRLRNPLPHPALTDRERSLLAFYVGGVYWRMRGAGLIAYPPDPEQGLLRRILYVKYPYQAIADLTGASDGEGVGDSILFDENWGWDEWWDMGTTPGSADKYSDLVGMTKRGKRGVNVVGPQVQGRGYDIRALVAGGLQMGPCYYFAWEQLASFRLGEALQDPYMWFIEWPTSLGEFCAGAALGMGLARTMLLGTPNPDPSCVPGCVDRECGDDGLGGSCGACAGELVCSAAGQCESAGAVGDAGIDPGNDAGPGDDGGSNPAEPSTPSGGCSAAADGAPVLILPLLVLALMIRRKSRS